MLSVFLYEAAELCRVVCCELGASAWCTFCLELYLGPISVLAKSTLAYSCWGMNSMEALRRFGTGTCTVWCTVATCDIHQVLTRDLST